MECQKHKLKKDFAFCLEPGCKDRLVCKKCIVIDKQHCDHERVCIEYFMQSDYDELVSIFNETYAQTIKDNSNVKQFNEVLDARFEKLLDEREEKIRLPFEKMISDYRLSLQKIKAKLCQKYQMDKVKNVGQIQQAMQQLVESDSSEQKQKEMKDMIDSCNQIISIQKELDSIIKQVEQDDEQMIKGIQQVINSQKMKIDVELGYTTNDLESAKQLQQCTQININDFNNMEQYRNQIKQYQQENKQFRIYLDFYNINDPNHRSQVISMIDQQYANSRVAEIYIRIDDNNKIDVESMIRIVNKYTSIYHITIDDYSNQVHNDIHDQLKLLVKARTLLHLDYWYSGNLYSNDDGLSLMKQYNQIITKDKDHLQYLYYYHENMDRDASQKQQIEEMIDKVSKM